LHWTWRQDRLSARATYRDGARARLAEVFDLNRRLHPLDQVTSKPVRPGSNNHVPISHSPLNRDAHFDVHAVSPP